MEKSNSTSKTSKALVQVTSPDQVPSNKHYAILIYVPETSTDYEPPYHPRDKVGTYTTRSVIDVQHWVTENREIWEQRIVELERGESRVGKAKYVAFAVDKLAKVELKVSIGIS